MTGPSLFEKALIRFLPVLSIITMAVLFYLIFPIYEDLGSWILEDLGSIPFLVWVPVAGVIGYLLHLGLNKKRELIVSYAKRIMIGLMVWFFLSIVISLLTETGDVFTRIDEGPLFKAWIVLMFVLLSLSPVLFGILSIFGRKRWSMGATVTAFFLLAIVCMIFSQGRYATALKQDPFLSLVFIWSAIAYIESISWNKRYFARDISEFPEKQRGNDLSISLLRRQIYFTLIFSALASTFAFVPIILFLYVWKEPPAFLAFYEIGTVFGKFVVGLLLLFPLMSYAVFRRWRDRMNRSSDTIEEGI